MNESIGYPIVIKQLTCCTEHCETRCDAVSEHPYLYHSTWVPSPVGVTWMPS